MAKKPTKIEIRSYQVGFGDCFLLTFQYTEKDKRHVLIDFGSTGLPKRGKTGAKPSQHMRFIAEQIRDACKPKGLTAVVATHRHADHINGFGTDGKTGKSGEIIRALKPRLVLQPWTEDPDAPKNGKKATRDSNRSTKSFVSGLRAKQDVARLVCNLAEKKPAWMSKELQKELSFLGQDNIANKSAIDNLIAMGQAKGATAVWAHHGSKSGLERLLPGVKVRVLGPPDLTQSEKIRKQRKRDPDQFWHMLGDGPLSRNGGGSRLAPDLEGGRDNGSSKNGVKVPLEARWFRNRLDRSRGSQLLEIVRTLDEELNNTSLILLFEVFGKKLLFPGDAQIENWSYALVDAPDAKKTKAALADVDVYKVGHHGSLNATPKKLLWEAFTKRGPKKTLKTLLSTMPGKHGKTRSKTEVPRHTLLDALKKDSELTTTTGLSFAVRKLEPCHTITVTPKG